MVSYAPVDPATIPAPPEASFVRRWYVLTITMLVYAVSIADRYVVSSVLEPIRVEFHLTDGSVAVLTGVALAFVYVLFGFPMSWFADRSNRRNLLAAAVAVWSVMTTLCGFARGYWDLFFARVGVGIGEAGGTPPCNAIIADYFPPARRPMAASVFALGAPLGAFLGSDVASNVAHVHGWRAAFFVLGIPGILLAALIILTVREPKRGIYDPAVKVASPSVADTVTFMARQRGGIHIMLGSGLSALWGWGLMWFTSAYIERMYHLPDGGGGGVLAPIHLVGGAGATFFTAWLVGQPYFKDARRILRLLAVVTALATIPSFYAYYTHSLGMMQVMLWLYMPAIYFYLGPSFAAVQNAAPATMRAVFCALTLFVANILNLIVAPAFVGYLSDYFSGGHPTAESLRLALIILAPSGFWAAFHYWRAERHLAADQERIVAHG